MDNQYESSPSLAKSHWKWGSKDKNQWFWFHSRGDSTLRKKENSMEKMVNGLVKIIRILIVGG